MKQPLAFHIEAGVAWLRLQLPQAGNRLVLPLAQALCAAADEIALDDAIQLVVLSAAGKDFCLGAADLGDWPQQADCIAAIGRLAPPVLAVLQGDAVAEGCELALACDLRLCADNAGLALPQLREGRLPRHGATQRLPRLIGRARALEMLLSGRRQSARAAAAMGLVTQVVAQRSLRGATRRLVTDLRGKAPLALRYAKEAVVKGFDMTLAQGIALEEDLYALLQSTADRREGVEAFLAKRRPRFAGR